MGFERLRQQKEAEALAAQQRAHELSVAKQAEETARQQEEELHRQRRQQAERFREESGIGSLIQEVKEIVSGPGYEIDIKGILNLDDSDSVYDYVVWGSTVIKIGKEEAYVYKVEKRTGRRIPTWGDPYVYSPETNTGRRRLVDYDGKFIIVESQPSGNIVFHGNENTEVSMQDWKDNKNVLESALEKSYDNPGFMYYSKYIDADVHERAFERPNGFNARFPLDSLVQEKRGQESPVEGGTGEGGPSLTAWEQIINEELYRYYQTTGKEIKYVPKVRPPVYIPQRELNEPPKKIYKQAPRVSKQSQKNDPLAPRETYPSMEELLGLIPGPANPSQPNDPRGYRGPDPRGPDPRGPR